MSTDQALPCGLKADRTAVRLGGGGADECWVCRYFFPVLRPAGPGSTPCGPPGAGRPSSGCRRPPSNAGAGCRSWRYRKTTGRTVMCAVSSPTRQRSSMPVAVSQRRSPSTSMGRSCGPLTVIHRVLSRSSASGSPTWGRGARPAFNPLLVAADVTHRTPKSVLPIDNIGRTE